MVFPLTVVSYTVSLASCRETRLEGVELHDARIRPLFDLLGFSFDWLLEVGCC